MKIYCVWEHNQNDSLIYFENLTGAYVRGEAKEIALCKAENEAKAYLRWIGEPIPNQFEIEMIQEKESDLTICDADSDIIFESETGEMGENEYIRLKKLALKSAEDFQKLYDLIPNKNKSALEKRETFYGAVPITANEMYAHTKNVNAYYFGEIGILADNAGDIFECRKRGFDLLEKTENYLENKVFDGSYGEMWSLKKVLRRFIWHDRIHAKAMYKMAIKTFGEGSVEDVFRFEG